MKKLLLLLMGTLLIFHSHAQVTQINSNKNLELVGVLNSTKSIFESDIDQTIWISDGTLAGTFQLSDTITTYGEGQVLNGKYIFGGSSPLCGDEIFITDGTKAGTKLIKDINPGKAGSLPESFEMTIFNGYLYFPAITADNGCEPWRTDGTAANTTLVKDINPGTANSLLVDNENLAVALNGYLYFAALTPADGYELWKSDGTAANTTLVKDIEPGTQSGIDSTNFNIASLNNRVVFNATTDAYGNELWSSDGTSANTNLLKDITAGATSSMNIRFFDNYSINNYALFSVTSADGTTATVWRTDGTPAGTISLLTNIATGLSGKNYTTTFQVFKNNAYFLVNDNIHPGEALWSTDGTTANTLFLKDLGVMPLVFPAILDAINLPNEFVFEFPSSADLSTYALWKCDGTGSGTQILKSFPSLPDPPFIFPNIGIDFNTQQLTHPLYSGKFFFSAYSSTAGNELWVSDGTTLGTQMVKDINPGTGDGINPSDNISFLYTDQGFFFAAEDGVHGNELWKTDGTEAGTAMVEDIFPGAHNANPSLIPVIVNSKVFFTAKDGNPADSSLSDLYVIDGTFSSLPVTLLNFSAALQTDAVQLTWTTSSEINSGHFVIQRSADGIHFSDIGQEEASGNSSTEKKYGFNDDNAYGVGSEILYYRLQIVDLDGKYKYSNILTVKLKGGATELKAYPNPVHNQVGILFNIISAKNATLIISDVNGKRLYSQTINGGNSSGLQNVDVSSFAKGIYFIRLITDGVNSKTIKFVKD